MDKRNIYLYPPRRTPHVRRDFPLEWPIPMLGPPLDSWFIVVLLLDLAMPMSLGPKPTKIVISKNIITRRWQMGRYFITSYARHPHFHRKEADKWEICRHSSWPPTVRLGQKWQRTQLGKKAIVAHNGGEQHTSRGPGSFLFGEGGDVGSLLFPVCSHFVLIKISMGSQHVHQVPFSSLLYPYILCPKFNSLWPSSKAEDYNISILGCPKLDFFWWWAHIFVFSACSQCVPACSQLCFSIFPICSPEHHTFIPYSLPQISPFLPI